MRLVKLGGSVITHKAKPLAFRSQVTRRLASELAPFTGEGLIVVHGAGGFGHVRAAEYDLANGLRDADQVEGTAVVQRDVRDLNLRVIDALLETGIPAVSIPAGAFLELEDGRLNCFDAVPFQRARARGLVPVTFGDVLMDTERGVSIASGDLLMAALAAVFKPSISVFVTKVDGVYEGDPGRPGSRLLPSVSPEGAGVANGSAGEGVADVTGSMGGKLAEAFQVAASSDETWIIGGERPGRLRALMEGRRVKGTRVLPAGGD
jgi:isopentenyl phosphate kinase